MSEASAVMLPTHQPDELDLSALTSPSGPAQGQFRRSDGGIRLKCGAYQLRLAGSDEDLRAVCRLRFLVFNLELNEGLESAYETGYDSDPFDEVCDHLVV